MHHTVNHYLDYLQGSYLIRALPPIHTNIRKRLTKSPKLYWRDSGLVHALLRVPAELDDLLAQPWVGASSAAGSTVMNGLARGTSAAPAFAC